MDKYNKNRPKYEAKTERPKEKNEYGRPVMPITDDLELHDGFMVKIQQIADQKISNKEHGIYQILLQDLRRALGRDEITRQEFDDYKNLADQVIDKEIAKASKKLSLKQKSNEKEIKKEKEESNLREPESNTPVPDFNKKKVRGEESLDEKTVNAKEELKFKGNKWGAFKQFIGSPISRILLFVVLAVFLMFYITKTNMADVLSSPMILILAVVFIVLIVGRGGKTRQHTYPDDSKQY